MTREEAQLIANLERLHGRPLTPCERRLSLVQAYSIGDLSQEPTFEVHFLILKPVAWTISQN